MKINFAHYLRQLPEESMRILRLHPVEVALILIGGLGCLTAYAWDDFPFSSQLSLVPLFGFFALAVNLLAGRGPWRKIYWVCWTPLIPLMLCPGLRDWVNGWHYLMTLFGLAPLMVLMCRRAVRNDRFVCDGLIWMRSAVLATLFVNVAFGLFCAILYSTTYIFGIEGLWTEHLTMYVLIVSEAFAVPLLFLMMADRWRDAECRGNRIIEVLLDYIVTPALLVYTAILYLYMGKILFTWSLPRGGVAYLVFGFILLAMAVQALQFLLSKRRYDWFFGRLGLISLPTLALFWAGLAHRTGEYGLTEPRVWLVVCGGLMSLSMVLFFAQRTGRYLYISLAAFVVFGAMTFVPRLDPAVIAVHSQARRAAESAERLGMLAADGTLRLNSLTWADTAQRSDLHRLYEALDYIDGRDSAAFARFGLSNLSQFEALVPASLRDDVLNSPEVGSRRNASFIYIDASPSRRVDSLSCYRTLYADVSRRDGKTFPNYTFAYDTLRVRFGGERSDFVISAEELLRTQLQRIGETNARPEADRLRAASDVLLTYRTDSLTILFSDMQFERTASALLLTDLSVGSLLIR